MKAKNEASPPKDELSNKLQESLRKSRPRTTPVVLSAAALAIAGVALLVWWLYPRPALPRLDVIAFDQVGVAGMEVVLHGRVALPPDESTPAPLENLDLIFEDGRVILKPGEEIKQITVKTGSGGAASSPWTFPADFAQGDFVVRRIGTRETPGRDDRGRVILYPPDCKLILVQVDQALAKTRDEGWEKASILDVAAVDGAATALAAISPSYKLVYLALDCDRPATYQKMRGWIRFRSLEGKSRLLAGPVLSRFMLERGARPWEQTGKLLAEKFAGPHVGVAGTLEAAQQFHAAGLTVYFLGQGEDLPKGVQRVQSWAELGRLLAGK